MTPKCNVVSVGSTGSGKSFAAARAIIEDTDEASITEDPHNHSLGETVLTHATGDVLHDRLSNIRHALSFEMLVPSTHSDPLQRQLENQHNVEGFSAILLRRRGMEGMATTPLMEEWVVGAIMLLLFQTKQKPITWLPYAFLPGTKEFAELVRDCSLPDIAHKFRHLEKLNPRALRAEVGSAARLINAVFRSPAFQVRCRGGFDLGKFLKPRSKLIIERGDEIGDDVLRVIVGAINLRIIDHVKRRAKPYPIIRIHIDEATNANLVGIPELRGIAETRKYGLFFNFYVQNLDFPGGADAVLQNCNRHEWYRCSFHELARKGAVDILAGLPPSEASRAERLDEITRDLMTLKPGWRWVRDTSGSRREYVPLLQNPWPDWPGLRDAKLQEKLKWIHARPEYGVPDTGLSSTSSADTASPPSSLPADSSPAARWRHAKRKPADGSSSSDDASASE